MGYRLPLFSILFSITFSTYSEEIELVFHTANSPPFQIVDSDGPNGGFTFELLEMLIAEQRLNVEYDIKLPWPRAIKKVETTPNHFIFTLARTPQRDELMSWVDTVYFVNSYFYALADRNDVVLNKLSDSSKYSLAIPLGDASIDILGLDVNDTSNRVLFTNTQDKAIQLLFRNRVDLNFNNSVAFGRDVSIRELTVDFFKPVFYAGSSEMGFYTSKETSVDILHQFRVAMRNIKSNGEYQKLTQRYFGESDSTFKRIAEDLVNKYFNENNQSYKQLGEQ